MSLESPDGHASATGADEARAEAGPVPALSVFDAVAVIVGVVVGAGIFRLPSLVAMHLESDALILLAWLVGGGVSLVGALCYAELTTTYPHSGGEYHFLSRAYGPGCGFMFGWARMTVVQTGSIALLALIFGDYASELLDLGAHGTTLYAVAAIAGLTALNVSGVRQTASVQQLLFAATLAGLACVVVVGLFMAPPAAPAEAGGSNPGSAAFGLAMVMVLLTYGGWNESAYISAEVRDGRRNMSRALVIGIALITLGYLAVNYAYLRVLGAAGMAQSDAVAHDLMEAALGPRGSTLLSALVVVVVLASLNVTILTGARTNYALGREMPLLGALGQWSGRFGAPVTALLVQAGIALGLVLAGTMSRSGIEAVVDYLSPVFWLFFLLTGLSLFVLRWREPERERPFRVPLYPVTPALFCATSAYLLWSSLNYTGSGAFAGVAVLLTGIPVLLIGRHSARHVRADPSPPPATPVADNPVPDKGD